MTVTTTVYFELYPYIENDDVELGNQENMNVLTVAISNQSRDYVTAQVEEGMKSGIIKLVADDHTHIITREKVLQVQIT